MFNTTLKSKSKCIAAVWIVYSLLEMVVPSGPTATRPLTKGLSILLRCIKRFLLLILLIANVFIALSYVEDKEKK